MCILFHSEITKHRTGVDPGGQAALHAHWRSDSESCPIRNRAHSCLPPGPSAKQLLGRAPDSGLSTTQWGQVPASSLATTQDPWRTGGGQWTLPPRRPHPLPRTLRLLSTVLPEGHRLIFTMEVVRELSALEPQQLSCRDGEGHSQPQAQGNDRRGGGQGP